MCGAAQTESLASPVADARRSKATRQGETTRQPITRAHLGGTLDRPGGTGISTAFMTALNARMSPSLMTPAHATSAPTTYWRKRLAITLKLLSRMGAKLEPDIGEAG